jgi:cell division protein FtsQ
MKLMLKILLVVAWIALAAGAVVLMSFAIRNHEVKPCIGLDISIDDHGTDPLFTTYDLKKQLTARFGKFESQSLDQVDVEKVISFLRKNPNIDKADAHLSVEGKLIVEITPCRPLVRVISLTGTHYYLDENGKLLPVNSVYPARVIVANGNIPVNLKVGHSIFEKNDKKKNQDESLKILMNIHSLAGMIASDSVMNALVEQIYINTNGSIRLATKAGSHIIEFGDTSFAEEKFENLKAFYKFGLTKTGWEKYRTLNLTYKNQIVCTK